MWEDKQDLWRSVHKEKEAEDAQNGSKSRKTREKNRETVKGVVELEKEEQERHQLHNNTVLKDKHSLHDVRGTLH